MRGGDAGHGLEPVCVVGSPHLLGPLLHAGCNGICNRTVESGAIVDDINEFVIHVGRQIFEHLLAVEHILTKVLRGTLGGYRNLDSLLFEGFLYNLESKLI